jgi:hypothetical protein
MQFPLDDAEFLERRERNRSFTDVGAYVTGAVDVGADASPERVTSARASASLAEATGAGGRPPAPYLIVIIEPAGATPRRPLATSSRST